DWHCERGRPPSQSRFRIRRVRTAGFRRALSPCWRYRRDTGAPRHAGACAIKGGQNMKRRQFLRAAGIGLAATVIAKPAIAQSMPELKWRCPASWPKSLDTIYGTVERFAKAVAEVTDNKFQIQTFAAGEIVPGLQ